uniref:Serine/threonine-protein kinase 11-interacting protein n=1 Tax=Mastacembelus armatus TaxID=205130 RepID=A0A7N8XP53_9TELE
MAASHSGQSPLVHSLATLLRNDGDLVLNGSSTLSLTASTLQQLTKLFEQYLLSRSQQRGFLALPSHPADTASLLQLQFLFDVLQKTVSLKLINPPEMRLQSVVKIFPFKSLKSLELKRIPPHCLEGLRGVYSQLEVFTCSKSLSSLEELLSLCGGDLSSALPWLDLHTLNFSYNFIVCLDQSLSLLNILKSLDLSHNKIQECAEFLKPLSELEHLNLGYNCLQRAPMLGLSARAKLRILILRNNELETINGVEQLSSLQHLDLAYNLLLEHSQLAPLSLLHSLSTLSLEGNPLYFQKTHRTCTVRHLSPKAANLRLKLDGILLSSYELSVLPKPGQMTLPPVSMPPERSYQEASSGAGEFSDSMSFGEVGVSHIRRKKVKSKVKVRKASISEPSDTDYEPRQLPYTQSITLPYQKEIERMSRFREQLGDDWLRYHVATTASPPSTEVSVFPPPLLSSEPKVEMSDMEADLETESTLQWPGENTGHTESTLEDSMVGGQVVSNGVVSSPGTSQECQTSVKAESGDNKEEDEEEDLGVDLCHPLLVGVLSDKENDSGQEEKGKRMEVFLCIKQRLLLEVDVQHGQERCRLELDSLARVETTEAVWDTEEMRPAVSLQFHYISRAKKRRHYVLLDDDPQQSLQVNSPCTYTFIHIHSESCYWQVLMLMNMFIDDLDLLSEDCEVVDHRLKLFLDVEVFEEEEEFRSFLKMSAVKFGEPGEVPSLLVLSDQRIYFLEMTSEIGQQLSDWLQKRDSHPIIELSYLEVGLGSQSIHMEFGDCGVAYTVLVRDSLRCKRFFGLLTGIVREMAHKSDSKLKSISTTRLNPQHHLWHLVCEDIQADAEDGQLFFYILAFVLQEDIWMPLTVLATRETLCLLREDHQWRRSSSSQSVNGNKEQSSGGVTVLETLPISCVSSVHLWPSDQCRMDIKLYDETVKQEKMWCVRSESSELLQGLLAWVRAQWEAMFGVKLHTSLQDKVA